MPSSEDRILSLLFLLQKPTTQPSAFNPTSSLPRCLLRTPSSTPLPSILTLSPWKDPTGFINEDLSTLPTQTKVTNRPTRLNLVENPFTFVVRPTTVHLVSVVPSSEETSRRFDAAWRGCLEDSFSMEKRREYSLEVEWRS